MSSSSSETVLLTTTNNAILNINMSNVTKLTASNFLMWSRQIQALLDGYDLAGHLDGSLAVPPMTITTDNAVATNPAHTAWKRQDRLIYSALLGTITVTIQPILSTTTTAAEIWSTLTATYAKPSRGHFKQLKQQLKTTTKGTKSINEYVQGLTAIFDQLVLLGKPEDPKDQVDFILEGLPDDYKTLIDQVEGRDTTPSITELHEKLINHEAKLQSKQPAPAYVPVTANFTNYKGNNRGGYQGNKRGGYQGNNRGNQTWQ